MWNKTLKFLSFHDRSTWHGIGFWAGSLVSIQQSLVIEQEPKLKAGYKDS
ncbi:hypothetical protein [Microcoleus sp. B5-D4]